MKAISLWQPWASLIVWGFKRVETRSWETLYRGPVLIHAAKTWSAATAALCGTREYAAVLTSMGVAMPARAMDRPEGLPFGALIGVATVVTCYHTSAVVWPDAHTGPPVEVGRGELAIGRREVAFGDYGPGRSAWLLADVGRFREPVPYAGRQNLFEVPDFAVPADTLPVPVALRTGQPPVFADHFGPEPQ